MQELFPTIHQYLMRSNHILIVPHQNPDADALGSAGALKEYLENHNKKVDIFCATKIPAKLHFLPHMEKVIFDPAIFNNHQIDSIVILDSGDLGYAGVNKLIKNHPAEIINFDHHGTNEQFGLYNVVIPYAAATTEIIFHFLRGVRQNINSRMATALLAGLITDTDNFTNAATTAESLKIAGILLRLGGNLQVINEKTVRNKTLGSLRLWGEIMNRLTLHDNGLIYTYIKQADWQKHNVSENEIEGLANFLNNLEGGKAALILKETGDGQVKGSLRTTKNDVDVSALAKKLGGGGHKKAAGFTLEGTMEEVLKQVLTMKI